MAEQSVAVAADEADLVPIQVRDADVAEVGQVAD